MRQIYPDFTEYQAETSVPETNSARAFDLSFVRFFAVNSLIRRAVGTDAVFDIFDKPKSKSPLFLSGARTYRALQTTPGHLHVFFGNRSRVHKNTPVNKC
jgi:hypothetical protein